MSTVPMHRCKLAANAAPWRSCAGTLALVMVIGFGTMTVANAQPSRLHYRFDGTTSPGAIGSWRLQRGGPLPGYFQPVEIRGPAGSRIAPAIDGSFAEPGLMPARFGLLIGSVYRFRVTDIPLAAGQEVFPTVELIDRTYPPPALAWKCPIVIELTEDDLRIARSGRFVTKAIYVEDPKTALPIETADREQPWFDVAPGGNPLLTADALGRPVAMLRLGGRQPLNSVTPEPEFVGSCAPLIVMPPEVSDPSVPLPGETLETPPHPRELIPEPPLPGDNRPAGEARRPADSPQHRATAPSAVDDNVPATPLPTQLGELVQP